MRSVTVPATKGVRVALEVSRELETLAEQMLSEAYELVMSGWCQGTAAQDELGRAIEPSSAFARRWSATGALERVWKRMPLDEGINIEAFERANLALAAALKDVPQRWNDRDGRTRAEVLDALEEARALLLGPRVESPLALVEDLLDDLDRYRAIPELFERPA
jgi:hypothetical protein